MGSRGQVICEALRVYLGYSIWYLLVCKFRSLRWRHNDHSGVSNHQPHGCLLNRLFRCKSKKHQSSASLAFVREIHRGPVNFPHKWPVTRKMFPFDDVIMMNTFMSVVNYIASDGLAFCARKFTGVVMETGQRFANRRNKWKNNCVYFSNTNNVGW